MQHQHEQYQNGHDSNEEIVYGHQESVTPHNHLLTNENYPDDKHTRVIFQSSTEPSAYDTGHYTSAQHDPHANSYLQADSVDTYRAPLVYHKMESFYNNPHEEHSDTELGNSGFLGQIAEKYCRKCIFLPEFFSFAGYDANAQPISSHVAITPRPDIIPHNYHADYPANQLPTYDDSGSDGHGYDQTVPTEQISEPQADYVYKRNSTKKRRRQSSKHRDEQYKKFSNLANRMKSRTSTTERASSVRAE